MSPKAEGGPRGRGLRAHIAPERSRLAATFFASAAAGLALGLGVVFALRPGRGPGGAPGAAPGAGAVPEPAGVPASSPSGSAPRFADVTAEAGIRFVHEAGNRGRFYYPEVMGAGCAFLDYDGDGRLDIYFVNGNLLPPSAPSPQIRNALYRNEGGGRFRDVTDEAGAGDAGYGQGCASADFDGDGDEDLYVTNYGPNVLYRNRGDGTFERLEGVLADPGWGQSCAFFDADGDGDLDLYLQNYLEYSLEDREDWYVTVGGRRVLDYCSPSGYRGQEDRLFRNDGGASFTDVTLESGIAVPEGTGMGLVAFDFDSDGDLDIAVANDSRPNFFFVNEGRGRFRECGLAVGFAYNAEGGTEAFMGVEAGDYDGDGRLDLAVPALRNQGFNLFRNEGGSFRDVSAPAGLDAATGGVTGFAPVFLDYDLDGDLDVFFSAGEVRMGRTEAVGEASFEERYAMRSVLLENRGGRYVDVSAFAGSFFLEKRISRAVAAGDFDDDGRTDLLVTAMGGRPALLRNETAGGNWIGFRLVGKPPNTNAIGARLSLVVRGRVLVREISSGGSYLGQRDRRVVFGLGKETRFDALLVRWPSGRTSEHSPLEIRRYHTLFEGD